MTFRLRIYCIQEEEAMNRWMDEKPEMKVKGKKVILVTFQTVALSLLGDCGGADKTKHL